MSKVFQVILRGQGCSNRGVRYRRLLPTERDKVGRAAGKQMAQGADTNLDFRLNELKEGVLAMLVAVTKDPVALPAPGAAEPMLGEDALWVKLEAFDLHTGGFDKWFTGKDDDILTKIYTRTHEASPAEVEAIMGKALEVSTD